MGTYKGVLHIVEKRFCTRCNREVLPDEILTQHITTVKDGKIVGVHDKLIHEKCGSLVQIVV